MGRNTVVVIWLALMALALRPIESVDRAAQLVSEPVRLLGRITLPFAAAADAQAANEGEARGRVRELLLAEQEDARPADPALLERRGLIHAQLYDRSGEPADFVLVRFPIEAEIEPGMPVVCGDVYVGSVSEVGRALPRTAEERAALRGAPPLAPGEARVRLVTSEEARVGARCGALELVAGGLMRAERSRARPRLLAVRALQGEPGSERELRVHEETAAGGPWSVLAQGYRLGTLVEQQVGTRSIWAIEPLLDYRGGFAQVFVLCPPERAPAGALLAQDPFDPRCWQRVRTALDGELSPWRETRRVLAGSRAGLVEGAALARGSEFVGRIARTGYLTSDAECLGDPGFALPVLASVPEQRAPLHLGSVRSLGCDASRNLVYLAWEESAELARALGEVARTAQLYTSSGERRVPPGLHLGQAELPAGAGAHVLVLKRGSAGQWGTRLDVWIGEPAEAQSP